LPFTFCLEKVIFIQTLGGLAQSKSLRTKTVRRRE
jgi:hypothetical protein